MEGQQTSGKEKLKKMLLSQLEAKVNVLQKELERIDKTLYYTEKWHEKLCKQKDEIMDDIHEAEDIIQEFKEMENDN